MSSRVYAASFKLVSRSQSLLNGRGHISILKKPKNEFPLLIIYDTIFQTLYPRSNCMTDSQKSNDRLFLALYVRDGVSAHSQAEDRFHWALLAVPSNNSQATRFHARDHFISHNQTHWLYEEIHVSARGTPKLLAQTYIGDIADNERLFEILRDAPVAQETGWNCISWVTGAMEAVWESEALESGRLDRLEFLKREALRAADAEYARREDMVKARL